MPLQQGESQLALVGVDVVENGPQKLLVLFKDLSKGQDMGPLDLDDDKLWWAIESVTQDPAYPHRLIPAL